MAEEEIDPTAARITPRRVRSATERLADSWVGFSWLLAILAGIAGFVIAGHVFVSRVDRQLGDEFNAPAGLLGLVVGFGLFSPWIGVTMVLRDMTRSLDEIRAKQDLPSSVAAAQPEAAQAVAGEPHAADGHHGEEHHGRTEPDR